MDKRKKEMICKSCKRDIEDDSIYCRFCGEKQIRERKKKTEIKVPAPRQLPSGTWFNRVTVNGERVSISAETEKEYYAKARAVKAGLIEVQKAGPTLSSILRKYIDNNSETLSPSTIRGYEIIYKNRFQSYMEKPVDKIDFQKMINDEAKNLSAKTVSNSWGLVRRAMEVSGMQIPKVNLPKPVKYEGDWLDYEQIKKFLGAVKGEPVELAALLALHSLRQSEILDLTVESFDENTIKVKGATVQDKNQKFIHKETNKNASSARTIPIIIPRVLELLPESGKAVTLHPSSIRRGLEKCCISAGLPVVSIHDLRRTFASLAYHLKWSERTTMAVGGWSDMQTVHAVYEKLADLDKDNDIKKMRRYYKNGNGNANDLKKP